MTQDSRQVPMAPVMCEVGVRPGGMKMAPILRALAQHAPLVSVLPAHSGQHYDAEIAPRSVDLAAVLQERSEFLAGRGMHRRVPQYSDDHRADLWNWPGISSEMA